MKKYKKIIIIFSLILSVLFINITPVLCATIQFNFSDSELLRTVENPEVILTNNETSANITVTYYNHNNGYYIFVANGNFFSSDSYSIKFLDGDIVLYESDFVISSNNYYFTGSKYPVETETTTETTETTEYTETTEETENNNNNIIIDNTDVLAELKEIKSYLLMFFGSFFLYFGYKIVKETTNKKGDKL